MGRGTAIGAGEAAPPFRRHQRPAQAGLVAGALHPRRHQVAVCDDAGNQGAGHTQHGIKMKYLMCT